MTEKAMYKPSVTSKTNEDAIKLPFIKEHNIMGAKFRDREISQIEWDSFKKDWRKRINVVMDAVIENRIYIKDMSMANGTF